MALPRFHVSGSIIKDQLLTLPDAAGHHLSRVLRAQPGERIVVFNGAGGEHECVIESVKKNSVMIRPLVFNPDNRAPALEISLGLCVLKKDSMDGVLARATELGARHVTPIISDHCSVAHKVIRNREAHWQQVLVAACEQCGLNVLPSMSAATLLQDWVSTEQSDIRLIAVPGENRLPTGASVPGRVSLLIGPEGGFSDVEQKLAFSSGFLPVSFGARVLRAETAPIVALSVVHQLWGEFQVIAPTR